MFMTKKNTLCSLFIYWASAKLWQTNENVCL